MSKDLKPLQRPETHGIGDDAEAVFLSALPRSWIRNPLPKDYGKDWHIEISDKDSKAVKGKVFYVQLKGSDSPKYSKGGKYIRHTLEYKHCIYFHQEVKIPVFLVVVDNRTKKGYWINVHEYLDKPKHKKWKTQPTLTFSIPTKNSIDDIATWQTEIERSITHMRAKAISLPDKLKYEIEQVERLDKRLTAVPFEMGLRIVPLEPVTFTCKQAKDDPEVKEKFRRLLDGELLTLIEPKPLT